LFIIVILPVALFLLSGCRPSPALEKLLYTQDADDLADSDVKMVTNLDDSQRETDDISPQQETEDSQDKRDRIRDFPVWGVDGDDERPTADVEFDLNATEDLETEGVPPIERAPNEDSRNQPDEDIMSDLDKGASITPDEENKYIVDAYGNYILLPSDIRRVSAVGEIANILFMLGGGSRLIATSESLSANPLAGVVFGEERVLAVEALWEGWGDECLSDEDFFRLLALRPDICIEISGQGTFSREQVAQLRAAGIAYVVLPSLNTTENIRTAISVLADILGDQEGRNEIDAPALAKQYIAFCDSLVADLSKRVTRFSFNNIDFDNDKYKYGVKYLPGDNSSSAGKYSIFINEWDEEVYYRLFSGNKVTLTGWGAPLAYSGYSNSPLSYYMSLAGVLNTPAIYQDFNVESKWYVNPLSPTSRILTFIGGSGTIQPTGGILTRVTNPVSLGSADFPAIIVPSEYIKEKILADPMWKFFGEVTSSSGMTSGFGFLDEDGNIIRSNIIGEYEIFVNPQGVGSWFNGSAESVLEAVWVAWKFHGAYSEAEVYSIIRDFYQTFYNYELSGDELALIMKGREDRAPEPKEELPAEELTEENQP